MKKLLLPFAALTLVAFMPIIRSGFPELTPDPSPAKTYGTQYGNSVNVSTQILIQGNSISNSFKVGFYLSTDTLIHTTDKLIGTYTVFINQSTTQTQTATLNNINLSTLSVPNGTYYIGTYVDVDNNIAENGMTPEYDNNSWAFRNAAGVFKVITFPALDASIGTNSLNDKIKKHKTPDGTWKVESKAGENLTVTLYDITGKQVVNRTGESAEISRQPAGIYVVTISNGKQTLKEKLIW